MSKEQIYYCEVGNCGWSTHKEYVVHERKNWKYIVVNGEQIGISKLTKRLLIRNFDDVVFNYIFKGWYSMFPCPAIEYYVQRITSNKPLKLIPFFERFNINKLQKH
jgi:hypothetical protein